MPVKPPSSIPAASHPPKKPSNPSMVVAEAAMIATEFAKDFDKLMEAYDISEYDVFFVSKVFKLSFKNKKGE